MVRTVLGKLGLGRSGRPALAAVVACALAAMTLSPPGAAGQPAGASTQPTFAPRARIVIFRLSHADASRMAHVFQQFFTTDAAVVADTRTNSVILSADEVTIEKAKRLFVALDVPLPPPTVTVVPATRPSASRPAGSQPTTASRPAASGPTATTGLSAPQPSTGPGVRPATTPG